MIRELMKKKATLNTVVSIMQDLITDESSKLKSVWPL